MIRRSLIATLIAVCLAGPALADPVAINIPSQSLDTALTALGAQAGLTIVADPALVRGKTAPAVSGTMEPSAALNALLKDSGLAANVSNGTVTVRKASARGEPESQLPEVSVTGSADTAAMPGNLPQSYAGGQVARGAEVGILGNRDYMETPFSITSYTAKTAQDQQARTLADVMANDPSVRNFYSPSFQQDAFFIRGFQADSGDFASGGLFGVSPLMRMAPATVERVEVLKGPSALLNGAAPFGSVGGMVNVVPKRATDQPITQLTGSFASDSQFGAHVDVGRRFGADNAVGIRFNGVYRDGDTALDQHSQELGDAIIGLDYRGESVRLSLDLGYQRQKEQGIENSFSPAGPRVPDAPDASSHVFQPWLYFDGKDTFGTIRGEVDVAQDVTLFAAFGGRRHELEEVYGFGFNVDPAGDFEEFTTPHSGYNETWTSLVGARAKFATGPLRHDLIFNASTLSQERGNFYGSGPSILSNLYSPTFIAEPAFAPFPGDIPKESELEMTGFALTDVLNFGERWTLMLGARAQQIEIHNFDLTTGAEVSSTDDNKVSPAVGVVYRAASSVSLYANYIEGLSPAQAFAANANQLLGTAVTKQVEAGAKADFNGFGGSVSVFRIEQPNQVRDPLGNYSLDGMQRNKGIELNVYGEAARGVRLLGGFMILDGVQVRTAGGTNDGKTALNAPELNVNLGAEWDLAAVPGLTLTARAIYTDEQYADAENTMTIPDWTRFDLGARYAMKAGGRPLTLRAAVENVTDEAYWANSFLYRGAPRTFLLSATIDF